MFHIPDFVFTPVGTIVVYLGIGVLMLLVGSAIDMMITPQKS